MNQKLSELDQYSIKTLSYDPSLLLATITKELA
jgi:hypothetical protein